MKKFYRAAFWVIICEAVGLAATPFTLSAIPTWYANLTKPFFSPPNWIFGPVWVTLYFLMGLSVSLVKKIPGEFYLQLFLNFLWSILFFGLHSPILGLIDIILLWYFILKTILFFKRLSPLSANLLIPYLAWVSFAAVLNLAVIVLN